MRFQGSGIVKLHGFRGFWCSRASRIQGSGLTEFRIYGFVCRVSRFQGSGFMAKVSGMKVWWPGP